MLFVKSRSLDTNLGGAARLKLMDKLQEHGLTPLIRSARLNYYGLALLGAGQAQEMERAMAAWAEAEGDAPYIRGDLFCFEDHALFLILENDREARHGIRAGIVYDAATNDPSLTLDVFCRNVKDALSAARDRGGMGSGNEAAALGTIEWQMNDLREPAGFIHFKKEQGTDTGTTSQAAWDLGEASAERLRAVEVLESAEARRYLRRIGEAYRENQLAELVMSAQREAAVESLINRLLNAKLLRREILISCRKNKRSLFRLPTPETLEVVTASNAVCSECGAALADEKAEELLAPTQMASALLEDGSWLAARLRAVLLKLGLPHSEIMVSAGNGDGEVRVLANVCGELFLIALRDGDWTSRHARRALDEQSKTEATHLVIVATGKIQDEVRVYLREQAQRRARSGGGNLEIIIVEGVEAATAELQRACEHVAERVLTDELCELDVCLGLSVGHMLATRFRLMQQKGAPKSRAASAAAGAIAEAYERFTQPGSIEET